MRKNKKFAALLAIFGGSIGLHRFYLGQPGLGILYILFFMFFGISGILGIIDAFMLFFMSDEEFEYRYNKNLGQRGDFNRARREQMRQRAQQRSSQRSGQGRPPQRKPRYNPQTSRRRPADTRQRSPRRIPKRNPYKQTGIKKFKEFALEEAIEDFRKGLEISPNDISLHFNIACAYSLTEQADLAFKHLSLAVQNGFKDFDLIKSHDALAYARIQPNWDEFESAGFKFNKNLPSPDDDNILEEDLFLEQIKKLVEMRQKGILTEEEFMKEKAKLQRR